MVIPCRRVSAQLGIQLLMKDTFEVMPWPFVVGQSDHSIPKASMLRSYVPALIEAPLRYRKVHTSPVPRPTLFRRSGFRDYRSFWYQMRSISPVANLLSQCADDL